MLKLFKKTKTELFLWKMDDVYLLVLKHIKQFFELSTLYHVKVYRETMFSIDMAYVVDRQINK